jgi:S1-C subfamily serine protease
VLSVVYLLLFLQRPREPQGVQRTVTPASEAIQAACEATVLIKSPWGGGSGFFIDPQGRIVTNRHVVAMVPETAQMLREERDKLSRMLHFAGELPPEAAGEKQPLPMAGEPVDQADIKKRIDQITNFLRMYAMDGIIPKITVKTDSDREFSAMVVQTSEKHDLALLKVRWGDSPTVPLARSSALKPGEQVFAIGSPFGIRRTVSSGIVSGWITIEGEKYLQTDTPINPGNSGGPLLSRDGEIVGVNTMMVANAQGLSFAIPIETVRREFQILD